LDGHRRRHKGKTSVAAAVSIEDIKAAKETAERIGVGKLRQLAEVVAK
jgi:hypothetical protein